MRAEYQRAISTAPEITYVFLKVIEHIESEDNYSVAQALTSARTNSKDLRPPPYIFWEIPGYFSPDEYLFSSIRTRTLDY